MDISKPDYNDLLADIAALKGENAALKAENARFARLILDLQETVKQLRDEINRLKGQKSRPNIPPSSLEKGGKGKPKADRQSCPPISGPKKIRHEQVIIQPQNIPAGSRLKGYSIFHVEELNIEALKIKYRLAIYETPTGEILRGQLPSNLKGKHFGTDLIAYCLDQYHARGVT